MAQYLDRNMVLSHPFLSGDHDKNDVDLSFILAFESLKEWIENLPVANVRDDSARPVRWSGWRGTRYTRCWCPACKKSVRNDDCFCHWCGQRLIFPQISFTPYVKGEPQQVIVKWEGKDDSE